MNNTNDRVQLKREEIVGNDVSLSDINPKSNTKSIDDSATGISLDKTIDRLWNAINNKLTRVVNSVNGRTGVVVLNSDDVGLGNVDNVSFADIKNWVINRMKQEFEFKKIELFESLSEVDDFINDCDNDEVYANKPYYSHHGYDDDKRGYIGYIYWDPSTNTLKHTNKVLDTIGSADNSIVYNENVNGNEYAETGRIGVNIWRYEDALKVYNDLSGNKSESGLYIDKSKIAQKIYYFDGVYGDGDPMDPNALLYQNDPSSYPSGTLISDMPVVRIFVDGNEIKTRNISSIDYVKFYIKQVNLRLNDIIITNFNDKGYYKENGFIKDEMYNVLTVRKSCIGCVTQAPSEDNPDVDYIINFYSLRPAVCRGLKYITNHMLSGVDVNGTSEVIGLDLLSGKINYKPYSEYITDNKTFNVSGLNAFSDNITASDEHKLLHKHSTVTPIGSTLDVFKNEDDARNSNGSFIAPDFSLSVIPVTLFEPEDEIEMVSPIMNWPLVAPPHYDDKDDLIDRRCLFGVNLEKQIDHIERTAKNMSGLRITSSNDPIPSEWFGYGEEERNLEGIDDVTKWSDHSGGLSINVGKFLDIGSDDYMIPPHEDPTLYYDDGKLNVRINELYGLKNDGNNKIRINTYNHKVIDTNIANGGIGFNTSETQKGGIYVLRGLGIKATKYNQAGSNYELNPYAIGVNIIDHSTGILDKPTTLSPDGKVVSAPEYRKFYGGLRYINKTDTAESGIAVRVNEDDSWDENPNLAIGSRGLGISPTNVLGIQFYKSENYHNPLIIKSVEESIEDKYAKKIILPSTTIAKASGNDFPRPGEVDRVYVTSVNDRIVHFIWNPNTNTYEHMFEFVGSLPTTGVHNKVYVINGTDSIDLYTWGNLKTVLFPDINGDNVVNASDSHLIMEYYLDISSGKQPSLNEEQIKRADVTHSGAVDTSDSTWVSEFYADSSAGIYTNDIIGWRAFMKTKNIEDEPQGEGFNKIYSETESIPGIALEHDINRGLHVDDGNKLTVSINDVTSKSFEEYTDFNSGGLRFSSSGNIAIRLNDSNNYDADTGLGDDNIVNGTKGLCIDENNILGIKLNPTSSPLKIDDDGNLTLSEDIDVDTDIEPLTIKDSNDNIITFDGKTPVTITLGPGLEILPD